MNSIALHTSKIKILLLASIISFSTTVAHVSNTFAEESIGEDFSLINDTATTPAKPGATNYITVSLVANHNLNIDALQGYFSTVSAQLDGQTPHITLIGFSDSSKDQADFDYDTNNGLAWLVNYQGSSFSTNEAIFRATYKVDEYTPVGEYDVSVDFKTFTSHGDRTATKPATLTTKIIVSDDSNHISNPDTGNNTTQESNASSIPSILWVIVGGVVIISICLFGHKYLARKKS